MGKEAYMGTSDGLNSYVAELYGILMAVQKIRQTGPIEIQRKKGLRQDKSTNGWPEKAEISSNKRWPKANSGGMDPTL